ncbi:hypothetical protein NAT47_00375 [Flavobacterium sp. HXWNR69]|uniref:YD repeat-containing protein n=1 Tax=Flavobacterium fragile TaxID=2949085 RepID=A0ABT0TD25_9FLAO|nr:hypothetical protein [Flavobacterium sp. HXWNR69]MCL9768866.1 hypothetical protein [Flavobacterium sp. HXWNR69]
MKTKLYTILFLVILSVTLNAQELPQVVPPSPEASALFKFNEIPVSLNNGLHNTSIPLLEVSSGGVTIPISLSYHSRGVQVNEIASRVGTGWALSYGGMISRQIRGKADDSTNGYNGTIAAINAPNRNSTSSFYLNQSHREDELSLTLNDGEFDIYPDKYMISTNFFSGEFYYDKNTGTFLTQKFSDIKIIPQYENNLRIIGFQVIDNQGNNYYFGNVEVDNIYPDQFTNEYEWVETTYTFNSSGLESTQGTNTNFEYSSWFLKKIITNTNEEIDFEYQDEITTYIRRNGDKDQYTDGVVQPVTCHFSKIQSHQKRLSAIHFDGGKVEFKSENQRDDVQGGFSLDKIKLINKSNKCVKQIQLNYYYTNFTGTDNINSNSVLLNDNYAKKRLFLESVEFKDSLGTNTEKKYQFEYDDQILPSRHSNSIDFWGYYNGKNRGDFINWGNTNYDDAVVNPIKVQAGLLKKIIYPTGGYTTFEYEPNIVLNELPITSNVIQDVTITANAYSYKIPNTNPIDNREETIGYFNYEKYSIARGRYESTFTVSSNVFGRCQVNINTSGSYRYFCYLRNSNNNIISLQNLGTNSIALEPGTYTLIFDPDVSDWNQFPTTNPDGTVDETTLERIFWVHLSWIEAIDGNYIYAPGNRIKKISNFTAESNIEFSKLYTYVNETNNVPNGSLFSTSNFRVIKYMVGQFPIYDKGDYQLGGVFSSFSKDNFGYHTVNEYFLDRDNNSKDKITNRYSFYKDLGNYYRYPYHPISDNEWLRGLDLSKIFYKKDNGVFKKVKEINNEYLLNNSITISLFNSDFIGGMYTHGIEIEKPMAENFSTFPYTKNRTQFSYPNSTGFNLNHYVYNAPIVLGYRTSFLTGGTLDLHQTKVTEYFDNGQEMETVTTYGYDYNNHYNVASVSTTNSLGETSETKYQYASNTSNPVNNAMVAKNMVAIPLVTESYKNGEKLSTIETVYKDWNADANITLLAPEFIKASKGTAPLETRVIYNLVDADNGNPKQVQKEGGMTICYIWGYNKTQPVAKLENIAYSAIPSSHIQAIENATNEANLIIALNALRNDTTLSNAMITTYTYKPLVGISSVTDPKGDKQTYHYDGFGRLQYVKDAQDKILSENQYHYKTQN